MEVRKNRKLKFVDIARPARFDHSNVHKAH